jgi:hypothetical protein
MVLENDVLKGVKSLRVSEKLDAFMVPEIEKVVFLGFKEKSFVVQFFIDGEIKNDEWDLDLLPVLLFEFSNVFDFINSCFNCNLESFTTSNN